LLKTIGCEKTEQEVQKQIFIGKQEIARLSYQTNLFVSETDTVVEELFSTISNSSITTVGAEIIFTIYTKLLTDP